MSLASLSSLAYCLWVRSGAYPRVELLKGSSIRWVLASPTKLGRLARDKRYGLLQFVNYGRKKFYNIGPLSQRSQPNFFVAVSDADADADAEWTFS